MSPLAPVLESVVGSTVRPGDRRTAKLVRDWGDPPRHGPLPLQQFASHAVHDNRARRRVSALDTYGLAKRPRRGSVVGGRSKGEDSGRRGAIHAEGHALANPVRQGNRPRAEGPCFVPGPPRLAYPEILYKCSDTKITIRTEIHSIQGQKHLDA